jgi:hypothetical protein
MLMHTMPKTKMQCTFEEFSERREATIMLPVLLNIQTAKTNIDKIKQQISAETSEAEAKKLNEMIELQEATIAFNYRLLMTTASEIRH